MYFYPRTVYSKWNNRLKTCYNLHENVTIDEQLIPYIINTFRGRCPFRQYIPSKPGIKMFVMCNSKNSYCCNTNIYLGKERNERPETKTNCFTINRFS